MRLNLWIRTICAYSYYYIIQFRNILIYKFSYISSPWLYKEETALLNL